MKVNITSNEKKNYDHPTFKQYKKTPINLFPLYCREINYLREKKKKLKALGHARDKIHADGSCSQQDPRLMGFGSF
jgi:hypothetical protein